ncbi:Amidase domain-containing protein [Mycena kentingensis (nom. inval.)]|nr:Amidase domain-containing protein [Mycena kentingensis (nom. inval.)]
MPPSLHEQLCASKQRQRQAQLASLSAPGSPFAGPLSDAEQKLHALSLRELVAECSAGNVAPREVLAAYGKKALAAQRRTNCVSDFLLEEAGTAGVGLGGGGDGDCASSANAGMQEYPLLGTPSTSRGTTARSDSPAASTVPALTSAPLVRLLRDAGALLLAKTTVPACLFDNETSSDTFGRTTNPWNPAHAVGASTGGGAALLACGASLIEIATDLAGSARIPAHFCGIYGLKGSEGRFPTAQTGTPVPGLESVRILAATMARRVEDLEEFWRRVVGMRPWVYDFTCVPMPWRPVDLQQEGRKLKWGVIWDDGICEPTPACRRALAVVVEALRSQGHEVVDFEPPNIAELLTIGYQLVFAEGGVQVRDAVLPGETLNPPLKDTISLFSLPRLCKRFPGWLERPTDPFAASLLAAMHPKTVLEERALVVRRDALRAEWHDRWTEENLDFVLTVPHALPALENGTGERASLLSAGYTFLFNMLDYTAGVLPVTTVDKRVDALPRDFYTSPTSRYRGMSGAAKGAWSVYDARKMHGLPLGVQIAGRRMEEEKVLEGMKVVEAALSAAGTPYIPPATICSAPFSKRKSLKRVEISHRTLLALPVHCGCLDTLAAGSGFWMDALSEETIQYHLLVSRLLVLSPFALLVYEYALTLDEEISRYWGKRLTWGASLFYLNRYLALFGTVPVVAEFLLSTDDPLKQPVRVVVPPAWHLLIRTDVTFYPACPYHIYFALVSQILVAVILLTRTYALYERNKVILGLTLGVLVAGTTSSAIILSIGRRRDTLDERLHSLGCPGATSYDSSIRTAAAWVSMLVFDTVIFCLTLLKTFRHGLGGNLFTILLRDGAIYFFIMVACNAGNIVSYIAGGPILSGCATTLVNVLSSVVISRILLNLRDPRLLRATRTRRSSSSDNTYTHTRVQSDVALITTVVSLEDEDEDEAEAEADGQTSASYLGGFWSGSGTGTGEHSTRSRSGVQEIALKTFGTRRER